LILFLFFTAVMTHRQECWLVTSFAQAHIKESPKSIKTLAPLLFRLGVRRRQLHWLPHLHDTIALQPDTRRRQRRQLHLPLRFPCECRLCVDDRAGSEALAAGSTCSRSRMPGTSRHTHTTARAACMRAAVMHRFDRGFGGHNALGCCGRSMSGGS
jgi:hypothetical protein